MEQDHLQGTFDRDLDSAPGRSRILVDESFGASRRQVANPLLTVATGMAAVALIRASLRSHHFPWFVTGVGLLFLAFFLLQFHCLDCGRTGWLLRWRRHSCPAVQARGGHRQFRRVRVPGLMTQLVLWCYFLAAVFLLSIVVLWARP